MILLLFIKLRSVFKLLLMVVFVPVIAWIINFLILLNTSDSGHKHREFLNSVAGYEPLELDFNGRAMRIPPDYIESAHYKRRLIVDKHTSTLSMNLRWPDFVPRSHLGMSEVAGVNGLALIKIRMTAPSEPPEQDDALQKQLSPKQSNLKRILSYSQWNTEKLDDVGLVKYVRISPNENSGRGAWSSIIYVPIDAIYKKPTGEDFYINCKEKYDHIKGQHQFGIPATCMIRYHLKNQVFLSYLFVFDPLPLSHWRQLDQGIRHLMTTFTGVKQ